MTQPAHSNKDNVTPITPTINLKGLATKLTTAPRLPLVEGLLYRDSTAMLYGASNTGKSFAAVSICMKVAQGERWAGLRTPRGGGKVYYFAGEGAGGILARFNAHRERHGGSDDNVTVVPLAVNFRDQVMMQEIARQTKEGGDPLLLVFDSFASHLAVSNADENSNSDAGVIMAAITKLANDTGACVLLVHHTGKDDTKGSRGASAYYANLDTQIELKPEGKKPTGEIGVSLKVTKQRDGAYLDTRYFTLEKGETGTEQVEIERYEASLCDKPIIEDNAYAYNIPDPRYTLIFNDTPHDKASHSRYMGDNAHPHVSETRLTPQQIRRLTQHEAIAYALAHDFAEGATRADLNEWFGGHFKPSSFSNAIKRAEQKELIIKKDDDFYELAPEKNSAKNNQ